MDTARRTWLRGELLIAAIPMVFAALFLWRGAGYVLDDWYVLSNAHFDGAWQAAGDGPGAARPGCIVVFALLFGPLGGHPAPAILLMAAMSAACAVLLMHLVGRFATRRVALLAGLVWVLLPNHMSMEVWVTAAIILTSQLLVLVGLAGGLSDRRSTTGLVVVALVLGAAVLTYEASLPVIAVAVVVLPLILRGRLDLPLIGATALTTGLATLWILIHWFGGKALQPWADASQLIQTSFGWGLTPAALADTVGSVGALIGLTALAASAYRLASPRLEATDTDRLVLGGGAIMVLGFLPFLRYFYAPLGAGDRVNYITAMGAAIVWAALLAAASRQREIAGGVGLAILAGVCLLARGERIELWATAGRDAEAIATATVRQIPVPPEEGIVLGPTPVQRENVAAFLDESNADGALRLAYGREDVKAYMSQTQEDFDSVPWARRIEIWRLSELDDVELLFGG